MKRTVLAVMILAVGLAGAERAQAGDREWATVGKVLTGVAAVAVIAHALDADCPPPPPHAVVAIPPVAVVPAAPVIIEPVPVVVRPSPVRFPPAPVIVRSSPVVVQPAPRVVAYPRMVVAQPAICVNPVPVLMTPHGFVSGHFRVGHRSAHFYRHHVAW